MNNLPTLGKSDNEMELPYLMTQHMTGSHLYKDSHVYDIRYEVSKSNNRPFFRVIFSIDHNGEIKYVSYLTSDKISKDTKLGQFINMVYNDIPEQVNMNDFLTMAKGYTFKVKIEVVNKYPTVTQLNEAIHDGQTILAQPGQPQPESPVEQPLNPDNQVPNPANCIYCSEPLPPNRALWTAVTYEGNVQYLCPKDKDKM